MPGPPLPPVHPSSFTQQRTFMTDLLERLINRLKRLPKGEQDKYAAAYLKELNDDRRWDKLFADTTDEQWKQMASEAREQEKTSNSTTLEAIINAKES